MAIKLSRMIDWPGVKVHLQIPEKYDTIWTFYLLGSPCMWLEKGTACQELLLGGKLCAFCTARLANNIQRKKNLKYGEKCMTGGALYWCNRNVAGILQREIKIQPSSIWNNGDEKLKYAWDLRHYRSLD